MNEHVTSDRCRTHAKVISISQCWRASKCWRSRNKGNVFKNERIENPIFIRYW